MYSDARRNGDGPALMLLINHPESWKIILLLLDNEGKKPIGGTRPIADARRFFQIKERRTICSLSVVHNTETLNTFTSESAYSLSQKS